MGPKERMRTIRMIAKAEKNPEMASRLGIEIKGSGSLKNSFIKRENNNRDTYKKENEYEKEYNEKSHQN